MTTTSSRARFRPEIEGLRAVAACLVMVYHVFLGRVSGGVDVFFVIAGFLITTTLLGHVRRTGGVAPGQYLARLAGRLVPLAALVLIVVLAAIVALMPITRMRPMLTEVAASALYVENWALAIQQVDYLARGSALSPVQHFWAMSIQGQFYLLWLALFGGVAFVARRRRADAVRGVTVLMAVLFAVSLAISVALTESNQPLAYFHTGARMWEFAAGGLVALAGARLARLERLPAAAGIAAGWLGLALIVSCGLLIQVSTAFPGWIALWPIGGALLVVLAGDAGGSGSRWSVTRLLGSRPLVFLGGVSYAIYLWHWPILVFYRARAGVDTVDIVPGLLIIGVSVALAIVTTRFVERPIRLGTLPRIRPWPTVVTAAIVLGSIAVLAVGSWRLIVPRQAAAAPIDLADYPGAAVLDPGWEGPLPDVPFAPRPLAAARDYSQVVRNRCNQRLVPDGGPAEWETLYARTYESDKCRFGDPDSHTVVVMVGGSHVAQWFDAVREIAEDRGWLLVNTTKSGCRFSADDEGTGEEGQSCAAWNAGALRELVRRKPDLVITTGTVTGARERIDEGFLGYARTLGEAGIPVVALRDNPRWPSAPVDCLALHQDDPDACWVSRSATVAEVAPWETLPDPPANVSFVDLDDWMCDGDRCTAVVGNVVTHYDTHHLTSTFARTLRPMLEARLPALDD